MDRQEVLDRAAAIFADRRPISQQMRDAESERGFRVVRPDEQRWLPAEDWDEGVCVSVDIPRGEVRLVAILAKRTGSFRRLLAALREAKLAPVVVCPVGPIMPAILKHLGWVKRDIGSGWEAEEQWRPTPAQRDCKSDEVEHDG